MTIEPEIIPKNSDEGENAKAVYPKWLYATIIIIGFCILIFFLNAIFSFTLMIIGLIFIWKQATKKLN